MGEVVKFESTGTVFRLRELVGGNGRGVISGWLVSYPGARARFRIRVKGLRSIPRSDWNIKQFRPLGGGIFEIKWESDKKQWRALGFDHEGYFLLVLGCTHKGNVYVPADCIATAKKRKAEATSGEWGTADYEP